MWPFKQRKRHRKRTTSKKSRGRVLVHVYNSHEEVQTDRDRMRRAGYYLASVTTLHNDKVRSVWATRHEVEMRGPVNA